MLPSTECEVDPTIEDENASFLNHYSERFPVTVFAVIDRDGIGAGAGEGNSSPSPSITSWNSFLFIIPASLLVVGITIYIVLLPYHMASADASATTGLDVDGYGLLNENGSSIPNVHTHNNSWSMWPWEVPSESDSDPSLDGGECTVAAGNLSFNIPIPVSLLCSISAIITVVLACIINRLSRTTALRFTTFVQERVLPGSVQAALHTVIPSESAIFGEKWIKWMRWCMITNYVICWVSLEVLVYSAWPRCFTDRTFQRFYYPITTLFLLLHLILGPPLLAAGFTCALIKTCPAQYSFEQRKRRVKEVFPISFFNEFEKSNTHSRNANSTSGNSEGGLVHSNPLWPDHDIELQFVNERGGSFFTADI